MKIGQFVSFGIGGADRAAENLIRGLLLLPDIELLVFCNKQSFGGKPGDGPRFDNYTDLTDVINIESVSDLNNYNLDVLGTHRPGDDTWFLPNFETTLFNFKVLETNFHGACSTKADFRLFPSQTLVNFYNISTPHAVLPNAILSAITSNNLREKLNIQDKFVYGHVARSDDDVYCNIFLEAYKEIENDHTVVLYISPCEQAKKDAERLQIKNIVFLPPIVSVEKMSAVYNTFDVFCHSNGIGETFGNTIAEAMIMGKPVITHKGFKHWPQAQKELLGEFAQYLYVEDSTVENYASIMRQIKDDNVFYNNMSQGLRNKAILEYDYKIVAKKYADFCKCLQGRHIV